MGAKHSDFQKSFAGGNFGGGFSVWIAASLCLWLQVYSEGKLSGAGSMYELLQLHCCDHVMIV